MRQTSGKYDSVPTLLWVSISTYGMLSLSIWNKNQENKTKENMGSLSWCCLSIVSAALISQHTLILLWLPLVATTSFTYSRSKLHGYIKLHNVWFGSWYSWGCFQEINLFKSRKQRQETLILTLIKNGFKRYTWKELVDFPQDICFVSKRCVAVPDLYNILPVTNANTDANNLVVWYMKRELIQNTANKIQLLLKSSVLSYSYLW